MAKTNYHFHNVQSETHVTEQRAPTDESVRLLKEMESEAKQKIVESITVNNTNFECNIQKVIDGLNDNDDYWISYVMNGKKSKLTVTIPRWKMFNEAEKLVMIRDEIAKDIASNMLDTLLRNERARRLFIGDQH